MWMQTCWYKTSWERGAARPTDPTSSPKTASYVRQANIVSYPVLQQKIFELSARQRALARGT